MANFTATDLLNQYVSFRAIANVTNITANSFDTTNMSSNGGYGEVAIDISDEVIQYGTINSVSITYTCYGSRSSWARATARTGYVHTGTQEGYSWQVTHSEAVARSDETRTTWTDTFTPSRSSDGKYHLLIGARNNIFLYKMYVYFSNISLYVDYTPKTYTITWSNVDGNGKTVTSQGEYGKIPACPVTPYKESDIKYNYEFLRWTPSLDYAYGDATYTAEFKSNYIYYTVTAQANNPNYGYVEIISSSHSDAGWYYGQSITMSAVSYTGYKLVDWLVNGESIGRINGYFATTITGNTVYTAVFELDTRSVVVTAEEGCESINVNNEHTMYGCGTTEYEYDYGTNITLSTSPAYGYTFDKWLVDIEGGRETYEDTNSVLSLNLATSYHNIYITAVFRLNKLFIGSSYVKSIYVGANKAKAVYIGTTKILE